MREAHERERERERESSSARSSNFELLRILAMFGVVIFHGLSHNGADVANFTADMADKQHLYLTLFSVLGVLGNHIFFMLAGYFLANKEFKLERIKKLVGQTWFYSVSISLVVLAAAVLGITAEYGYDLQLNFAEIARTFFPIVTGRYWFITSYIIIIIMSPCLNILLRKLNREQFKTGLIVCLGAFYLLTMISVNFGSPVDFAMVGHLLQYGLTYALGVYFALYKSKFQRKSLAQAFLVWAMVVFWAAYSKFYSPDGMIVSNVIRDWLPFTGAVLLFLWFRTIKISYNKIINKIATCVFPIYLIHEHPYVSTVLGYHIFDLPSLMGTKWVYLFPLMEGLTVFTACLLIELCRKRIIAIFQRNPH
jgi:hypothetical protein